MYDEVRVPANNSILSETYALFSLYRSIPGYPRKFKKNEVPDWVVPGNQNSNIHRFGLEITIAADDSYFEYYSYKTPQKLSDVLKQKYSHPGVMYLCKHIDGKRLWVEYLPKEMLLRKLEWPPTQEYKHLCDLPEAIRRLLLSFDVAMIHADSPKDEPTWDHRDCGNFNHMACSKIRQAFDEKLMKLNDGYDLCNENHLCIVCPEILSVTSQTLQEFLRYFCDSQTTTKRRFDRVFLLMSDHVVDFDLCEEKVEIFDHRWTLDDSYALVLGLSKTSNDSMFDPDALYNRLHDMDINSIRRPSTAELLVNGAGLTEDTLNTDIATLIQRGQDRRYGHHWFVDDRDKDAS